MGGGECNKVNERISGHITRWPDNVKYQRSYYKKGVGFFDNMEKMYNQRDIYSYIDTANDSTPWLYIFKIKNKQPCVSAIIPLETTRIKEFSDNIRLQGTPTKITRSILEFTIGTKKIYITANNSEAFNLLKSLIREYNIIENDLTPESSRVHCIRKTNLIAKGSFGDIYEAECGDCRPTRGNIRIKCTEAGKKGVIKEINIDSKSPLKDIIKEVIFLQSLVRTSYVVKLFEAYLKYRPIVLFMENLNHELNNEITKGTWLQKNKDKVSHLMKCIISGVYEIHQMRIIHRDLKPQNIMLKIIGNKKFNESDYYDAIIIDFGLSITNDQDIIRKINAEIPPGGHPYISYMSEPTDKLDGGEVSPKLLDGTPNPDYKVGGLRYMPPEIDWREPYSYDFDIWSIGLIYWDMLTGEESPFNDSVYESGNIRIPIEYKNDPRKVIQFYTNRFINFEEQIIKSQITDFFCNLNRTERSQKNLLELYRYLDSGNYIYTWTPPHEEKKEGAAEEKAAEEGATDEGATDEGGNR